MLVYITSILKSGRKIDNLRAVYQKSGLIWPIDVELNLVNLNN